MSSQSNNAPAGKISSAEFLEMSHPVDTHQWRLPVVAKTTGGRGSLFGGVGLAAGVVALQQATGKPIIWATGQYLSITQQPAVLDLEVLLPSIGRNVTQGRVVGHLGDKEIITILGACGERPNVAQGLWQTMPDAPAPDDCEPVGSTHNVDSLHQHVDVRVARGMFGFSGTGTPSGDDRSMLWARMPEVHHDAGALAIIADYMPSALGNALGHVTSCTSLDNTIRFANLGPSEWILCDNRIEFIGNGFGYGRVNMWSQTGQLLATASQSMIVRVPEKAD
ncbi:MAG: acyl-CoA thioesterase-2 [Candidatus Pseudothioglobus sp.]|jgi:acyl-CoA thioesterase